MNLTVTTPLAIVAEADDVAHLRAEDETGAFGILSGHADFLTALAVSVVTWRDRRGTEHHVAVRGGMLEVLSQDYIHTARAKGAAESRVVIRHAMRGGLLPVVSFLGPATAGILTGSFVIETIFQIPGLGREFVKSAFNRDFFLVNGTVTLYAALIISLNLVVDIAQVWLNPKLKFE